uniref:EGF-like domain-containing protein n=2 Tax=Caenorhabditis tropicalis TaxID=1561998 RepID=A0A1I7T9E5_9PELO
MSKLCEMIDSATFLLFLSFIYVNGQQCMNGGTPINSTICQCPSYVVGDRCEIVKCQRFSIPDKDRCACAPGWYDNYCGLRGCRPPNEDHVNLDKRTLIVVFNTKTTMKTQLDTLKTNFKEMFTKMTTVDPKGAIDNWIESFIFYGFVQSGSQLRIQSDFMLTADDVIKFMNNITLYDGDVTQPVITAVQSAQQTFPKQRSHATVITFTDSPSSDATPWSHRFTDQNAEQSVLQISLLWKSRVSSQSFLIFCHRNTKRNITILKLQYVFFLSLPAGTNYSSNGVDVYRRLALTNHGDTFFIKDSDDLSKSLLMVMGSQYFSENVAVGYKKTEEETLTLYVDNEGDTVFILITIDTSTTSVLPTIPEATLYAEGPSYRLYTRSSKIGDTVTIKVNAGTIFNYRMFLQSKRTVLIYYNDDMYIDVGNGMPVIGVGMSATMQTYGFPEFQGSAYELRAYDGRFLREKIYSYVRPQLDCTFLFGFPNWDSGNCPPGPVTSLHTFYYNGYKQQRVSTGYCITSNHNPEMNVVGALLDWEEPETSENKVHSRIQNDSIKCNGRNIDAVNDPRLHKSRQFIFILEQHSNNRPIYQILTKEINQILSLTNSTTDSSYTGEFTLIVHDGKESHVLLSAYNPITFAEKFQNFVNSLQLNDNLDNTLGLHSIVQAQKMNIRPTAQVFYFTNQAVKTVQNISRTWDVVSRDVEVNFLTIADGVTTEIFALPKELELIQKMTNGKIIPLTNNETTLIPVFSDLIGVSTLTTDNEQYNCHDSPLEISGYIEDGAEYSVIQIVGTGIKTIKMQDSNGALISVSDYITYQNPNFISFRIGKFWNEFKKKLVVSASNLFASGVWKISALVTSGGCQITVRQKTSVGMILGFTSSNTDDTTVVSQIITQRSRFDSLPIYAAVRATNGIIPTNLEIHVSVCHGEEIDKFGRCVCPERYTGEYCWDRICVPPATLSNGICCCTSGVHGDFCEVGKYLFPFFHLNTNEFSSSIVLPT